MACLPSIQSHFPLDFSQDCKSPRCPLYTRQTYLVHFEPSSDWRGHFSIHLQLIFVEFILTQLEALELAIKFLRVKEAGALITRQMLTGSSGGNVWLDIFVQVIELGRQPLHYRQWLHPSPLAVELILLEVFTFIIKLITIWLVILLANPTAWKFWLHHACVF